MRAALVVVVAAVLAGCSTPRPPDYLELTPWASRGSADGTSLGHLSGAPGSGQDAAYDMDSDARGYGLAVTLGWWLAPTRSHADVLARLDAIQDSWEAPKPPVVNVPAVSVDPALQAALEAQVDAQDALAVSVRRLEETVAAMPPPPPPPPREPPPDPEGRPWWVEGLMLLATALAGMFAQKAGLPAKVAAGAKRLARPSSGGGAAPPS